MSRRGEPFRFLDSAMSLGSIARAQPGLSRPETDRYSLKFGRRQTRELPPCVSGSCFARPLGLSVCLILSLGQQGRAKKMCRGEDMNAAKAFHRQFMRPVRDTEDGGQLRSAGQRAQNAEHKLTGKRRWRLQDTKAAQMNGNSILSLVPHLRFKTQSHLSCIPTASIVDNHAIPKSAHYRIRYRCSLLWE